VQLINAIKHNSVHHHLLEADIARHSTAIREEWAPALASFRPATMEEVHDFVERWVPLDQTPTPKPLHPPSLLEGGPFLFH